MMVGLWRKSLSIVVDGTNGGAIFDVLVRIYSPCLQKGSIKVEVGWLTDNIEGRGVTSL